MIDRGPDWYDRLVELHVLTEIGDSEAAAAARTWLARDDGARQAWDRIDQVCHQVRTSAAVPEQWSEGTPPLA